MRCLHPLELPSVPLWHLAPLVKPVVQFCFTKQVSSEEEEGISFPESVCRFTCHVKSYSVSCRQILYQNMSSHSCTLPVTATYCKRI